MNQSRETNNRAIGLILEGRHEEARDLLRDALEARLSEHNPQQAALLRQSLLRCVTPDVASSETGSSLTTSDDAGNDTSGGETATTSEGGEANQAAPAASATEGQAIPGAPVLYSVPFEINNDTVSDDTAVIVFNMALSYHLQDRTSWKARLFYEVSAILQLVRGIRLDVLEAVTMNNLALWCYDNHDRNTSAQRQFEESIRQARANAALSSDLVASMLRNLQASTQAAVREGQNDQDENAASRGDETHNDNGGNEE